MSDTRSGRAMHRRGFLHLGGGALAAGALAASGSLLAACGGENVAGGAGVTPPGEAPSSPAAPSAPEPAPAREPAGPASDALVTEIEAMASVVGALQYVHESPIGDRRCGNCQLYTPGPDGRGRCQLFTQGLVRETGWCASWVPRTS